MESHPTRVRGLKCWGVNMHLCKITSHPTWVRGLKYILKGEINHEKTSHPTRVRGLKSAIPRHFWLDLFVASHAGAWIEISEDTVAQDQSGRIPHGCVD